MYNLWWFILECGICQPSRWYVAFFPSSSLSTLTISHPSSTASVTDFNPKIVAFNDSSAVITITGVSLVAGVTVSGVTFVYGHSCNGSYVWTPTSFNAFGSIILVAIGGPPGLSPAGLWSVCLGMAASGGSYVKASSMELVVGLFFPFPAFQHVLTLFSFSSCLCWIDHFLTTVHSSWIGVNAQSLRPWFISEYC